MTGLIFYMSDLIRRARFDPKVAHFSLSYKLESSPLLRSHPGGVRPPAPARRRLLRAGFYSGGLKSTCVLDVSVIKCNTRSRCSTTAQARQMLLAWERGGGGPLPPALHRARSTAACSSASSCSPRSSESERSAIARACRLQRPDGGALHAGRPEHRRRRPHRRPHRLPLRRPNPQPRSRRPSRRPRRPTRRLRPRRPPSPHTTLSPRPRHTLLSLPSHHPLTTLSPRSRHALTTLSLYTPCRTRHPRLSTRRWRASRASTTWASPPRQVSSTAPSPLTRARHIVEHQVSHIGHRSRRHVGENRPRLLPPPAALPLRSPYPLGGSSAV